MVINIKYIVFTVVQLVYGQFVYGGPSGLHCL
jgi:hypothetical protein